MQAKKNQIKTINRSRFKLAANRLALLACHMPLTFCP